MTFFKKLSKSTREIEKFRAISIRIGQNSLKFKGVDGAIICTAQPIPKPIASVISISCKVFLVSTLVFNMVTVRMSRVIIPLFIGNMFSARACRRQRKSVSTREIVSGKKVAKGSKSNTRTTLHRRL